MYFQIWPISEQVTKFGRVPFSELRE